jgi:D-alanyl-D-alanine dipeptidase
VRRKPSLVLRFLIAFAAAMVLIAFVFFRVTQTPLKEVVKPPQEVAVAPTPAAPRPKPVEECSARGWGRAAEINRASLKTLRWAPFGRPETGWEVYVPLIQREIGTGCAPDTAGFAAAFAAWQGDQRLLPDGVVSEPDFVRMKGIMQTRRAFVRMSARGICPRPANEIHLAAGSPLEGYAGKKVQLRPGAFAAYRRMVAAAKAENPEIARDPRNLTIFSAFRSPSYDAARCATQKNCNGIVRAKCSPHRTGLAMDIYVGQAPGYGPDSSADPNRRYMTQTPTYRWLLANAHRFGFVNYPFEPWHWEWTGENP